MMENISDIEPLSWRDPDGFVLNLEGRILRAVVPEKAEQVKALIASKWLEAFVTARSVPTSWVVPAPDKLFQARQGLLWIEHTRLHFPCYPHEITALQLFDSADLTLKLASAAARSGWMLKDASAWNVLHDEGRPVFVDLLSFDRPAQSGLWLAYGQFVRHFIIPLLLYRKLGMTPSDLFLIHRDGITPERAFELLGRLGSMSRAGIEHVYLPKIFARAGSRLIAAQSSQKPRARDPEIAKSLVINTLERLRGTLTRLRPDETRSVSVWKTYEEDRSHYSETDISAKTDFVKKCVRGSVSVLDLGCNAGEFSILAAEAGATVVATDSDHPALGRLYARIRDAHMKITPMVLNIARPTPAVGWGNRENTSFINRATGYFDCVLCLGLLHHLLVSERATLSMIVNLLIGLDSRSLILEWIEPNDVKFRQLAGFDWPLYSDLSHSLLEAELGKKFGLGAKLRLPCATRVMYHWYR